ncbi:DUF3566 domain-containing protein [Streptomyces sp. NPDC058424]|uniref:DUF3566 domain-containing protein n=1 Tax=Streptomyces sp. NPDC058424 TaxID=3346491 RepID=UPI003664C450
MSPAERQERGTEASGQDPAPQQGGVPDRPVRSQAAGPGPSAIRMRISRADPWSVMTTSCLVLLGLGACVLVTMVLVWAMLTAMDPEAWPSFSWTLVIAAGVVTLEVVLGTAMATLGAVLYNMSSQYAGGVHLTLAEDAAAASDLRPDLRPDLLPDVGGVFHRLQVRLGFPPPGCGARYVEFVDRCGDAWRRLHGRAGGGRITPQDTQQDSRYDTRQDKDSRPGPDDGHGQGDRERRDRDDPDTRVEETTPG